MHATYCRHGLVLALLVLTGAAGVTVGLPERVPPLPPVGTLIAHSGWSLNRNTPADSAVCSATRPSLTWNTAVCTVSNGQGMQAQLYVGAESVQKMVHWSGELGYAGAGYLTAQRGGTTVRLEDGRTAPASYTIETHLTDRELEVYAIVAPGYIAARSTDNLLRDGWDVIRGHSGPYFVVRVSVYSPTPATDEAMRATATRLMAPVLARLSTIARGAATTA